MRLLAAILEQVWGDKTPKKNKTFAILSLFTSSSTLICCALPALVATLAGGIAVSGMVSAFPILIPISQNKEWIFLVGGILLALNGYFVFRKDKEVSCDLDDACGVADQFNRRMLYVSGIIYSVGAFFAFALVPILRFIDNWNIS
jgi:mercuric ion transport protein